MKRITTLLSLMLIALLLTGFIAGCGNSGGDDGGGDEETGSVAGYVMDENNDPISGATCTITTNDSRGMYSSITDTNGYYTILNVPVGTWPMSVVCSGYSPLTMQVQINPGQTTQNPTSTLPPGGTGAVAGTVYSEVIGGNVISGATVTAGSVTVTSTAQGIYSANGVAAGNQIITATASGYAQYSSTVTVTANSTVTKDIAMTTSSTPSPTPSSGYGNVAGKVVDVNGTALANVSVTLQKGSKATTDPSGTYLVSDLTPGVRTLAYAKTGYDSRTQDITVEANATVTAPTVTMTTTPVTGTTLWVSKRINLPEVNNATEPDVSNDGSKVTFTSNGNVIANWGGGQVFNPGKAGPGSLQIYVWTRATGTIARVSNNNLVPGSTAGANNDSRFPAISGDGNFVVYRSLATDILPNDLAVPNNRDIFLTRLSDNYTIRITNDVDNSNKGGNAASDVPDINSDGTKIVFSTQATNIGNINHTAGWSHIYYVTVSNMVPGIRRMLDCTPNSTEGVDGVGNPESTNPSISYEGRYTAFESKATNLINVENQPGAPKNGGTMKIFRNDINIAPVNIWNMLVSTHNGEETNADCNRPYINDNGTRIVFDSAATNLGYSSATTRNIYMWSKDSISLTFVSKPLLGAEGQNTAAAIDRSGRYVIFRSTAIGLVPDVTNATGKIYAKDMQSITNEYTLVSRGSSDQVPTQDCNNPEISGDGNYTVFDTTSKNLTNDEFTAGTTDVFMRKWK